MAAPDSLPMTLLRPLLAVALSVCSMSAVAAYTWTPPVKRAPTPYLELPPAGSLEAPPTEPLIRRERHVVAAGDTLGALMAHFGAPLDPVRKAALAWHDLSKLALGRELLVTWLNNEALPAELRYNLDEDNTLVVTRDGDRWVGRLDTIQYALRTGVRAFTVQSSLWQAAVDAGLRPADIAALAEVFEYDIDFNTEVQRGATATMVVEEKYLGDKLAKLGRPEAVRFKNGDKTYMAIRYTRADGSAGYYDADGVSRKKAFLRSPLAFSNVTSGFNLKRFHPVLKTARPHYGTDFGAPTGTPVRAVADGVVVTAGKAGGHGNFVKLQHANPYASSYSHLSKIAVKNGARVKQGDIIGYVGTTGLSTGPHLHFQLWNGGAFINPMTANMPSSEALPADEMAGFIATRDRLLAMLAADGAPPAE